MIVSVRLAMFLGVIGDPLELLVEIRKTVRTVRRSLATGCRWATKCAASSLTCSFKCRRRPCARPHRRRASSKVAVLTQAASVALGDCLFDKGPPMRMICAWMPLKVAVEACDDIFRSRHGLLPCPALMPQPIRPVDVAFGCGDLGIGLRSSGIAELDEVPEVEKKKASSG